MHDLKYLLPYMKHQKMKLLWGLLGSILATSLAVTTPYLLGNAVDKLTTGRPQSEIVTLALIIVGIAVVQGVGEFFSRYLINGVSRYVEYELRNDFFAHLQGMSQSFFQGNHTGDIMARATNDMSAVRQALGPGISNSSRTILMFVISSVLMLSINVGMALVIIVLVPVVTITFAVMLRKMTAQYEQVQAQFGNMSTYAQENFAGIRVVKAYAQEEYETEYFAKQSRIYYQHSLKYQRINQLVWPLMAVMLGLASVAILFIGGTQVIDGNMTLGQFVQFNAYLGLLAWPMIALGWVISLYQQGAASMHRIRELMSQRSKIADHADTLPIKAINGDIRFDHVSLRYDKRKMLDDVSFHAPAGTSLAIVGSTGAGKTSIVNLITRVYEAQDGQVMVDGNDVRRIPLDVLRRNIGYVPQDTYLFSTSLAENVAFGVENPDPVMVGRAVETARLSNDLDQFPERHHDSDRRAGRDPLGRAEAADGAIPRHHARPAHPDPGRCALQHRHADPVRNPGGPQDGATRSHQHHHLPAHLHRERRRPDPGPRRRQDNRARHPLRAGSPARPLRPDVSPRATLQRAWYRMKIADLKLLRHKEHERSRIVLLQRPATRYNYRNNKISVKPLCPSCSL